jgi:hypothetical protein
VKDGDATRSVLIFCSGTIALNRLGADPTYFGIVADYRKTFARVKDMKVDVLLAPHPEMYRMQDKRAMLSDAGEEGVNLFRRAHRSDRWGLELRAWLMQTCLQGRGGRATER